MESARFVMDSYNEKTRSRSLLHTWGKPPMAHLLLIDDDPDLLPEQVGHVFPAPAHRVEIAHTGTEGLERVAAVRPDVILLDLRLPDQSGLDVLRQLRQIDARIPVVFVTVVRSADSAIEAMRHGAYDYLLKPLDLQKLDRVIGEALKVARLMREPAVVAETPPDDDRPGEAIVGCCPAMQEVYKAIGRVADQTFPVLITGESGTGKELVARADLPAWPAGQGPVPGPQLRRHPGEPAGERAVRPREGCLHRGRPPPHRQVRAVQRGHAVPRRDRRHAAGPPGQDPARAPGAGVRARRRQRDDPHRRAPDRGHPPRPEGVVRRGEVPAGPVLPAGRLHHPSAALARARATTCRCWCSTTCGVSSRELGREVREVAPEALERLRRLLLAGQHPGAAKRPQAGPAPGQRSVLLPAFLPEPLGRPDAPSSATPREEAGLAAFIIRLRLGPDVRDLYADAHRQLDRLLLPRVLEYTGGSHHQAALLLGIARQTLRLKLRDLGLSVPRPAEAEEDSP